MGFINFLFIIFLFSISQTFAQWSMDQVCYKNFYLDRAHPAPVRCPPNDYFSYYTCCDTITDLCCRRPRELIIVIIVICLLLFICFMGCCVFGFLFRFVQGKNEKSDGKEMKTQKEQRDVEAQTEKREENERSEERSERSTIEDYDRDQEIIRGYPKQNPHLETKC